MSLQYPIAILTFGLCSVLTILLLNSHFSYATNANLAETFETIIYQDAQGFELEEYAFIAPMKGVPEHVLDMYCANIKLRLYWRVFREEVNDSTRKGIYLRRISRMAKHIYEDIRGVDKPFSAPRLSVIDTYFAVDDESDQDSRDDSNDIEETLAKAEAAASEPSEPRKKSMKVEKIKNFLQKHVPKVGIGIYTRWRTMWWLMMPCLFTKYYLWDPALDEFIKLKKTLIMYPDILTMKLQDINCLPVKLFRRILDVCKILNPLMNFSFGQLNLDKMTRFDTGQLS